MKRIRPVHPEADALGLYDAFGRASGYKIGDTVSAEAFTANVRAAVDKAANSPILLYGQRAERMFGFVAASLHGCQLIRQVDVGEIYASDETLQVPDYEVVLNSGEGFFVEVKNCHSAAPSETLAFRPDYLDGLRRYGAIFGRPVKVAVFWSKWRLWTLSSVTNLPLAKGKHRLNLLGALKTNEMSRLGDFMVGTKPPLTMRLVADRTRDRVVREQAPKQREVGFTIAAVEFYCNGVRVVDEHERSLAFYLHVFGEWMEEGPVGVFDGEDFIGIDFVRSPEEHDPAQGFAIIGSASSMISNVFTDLTVDTGDVERLTPRQTPGSLGILIDRNYEGLHLPLWRFHQAVEGDE